jgi:hypothetical protein
MPCSTSQNDATTLKKYCNILPANIFLEDTDNTTPRRSHMYTKTLHPHPIKINQQLKDTSNIMLELLELESSKRIQIRVLKFTLKMEPSTRSPKGNGT